MYMDWELKRLPFSLENKSNFIGLQTKVDCIGNLYFWRPPRKLVRILNSKGQSEKSYFMADRLAKQSSSLPDSNVLLCKVQISKIKEITKECLIPCSDRHFYCVNLNKCHYWVQYFIYKISINYCSIKIQIVIILRKISNTALS